MSQIAVFYHCKLYGDGIPDANHAFAVMHKQMRALKESGLEAAASEIHIGVNGDASMGFMAASLAPDKSHIHVHGNSVKSEISTQSILQQWLPGHDHWRVLYHHTKGITHPGQPAYDIWRQRMEDACVWSWETCITDLSRGYDAVGCHWLTPQKFPHSVTSPFFGGTFWWATSGYLSQLPRLPEPTWENRFEAESWIGRRRPYPRVRDYFPGWP